MTTCEDVLAVVEQAILSRPRNHQVAIGPSGIGTDCDRCLGHMLAGTPKQHAPDWLPYIGVAMHAMLEQVFQAESLAADARGEMARWSTEARLWVGDIDGEEIWGNGDLFDHQDGTSIDYKLVGVTTLRTARASGPSQQYRVQAHLYGRGWQHNGVEVNHVAIWYLPRNATRLSEGIWWTEPYDEQVALDALARADALAKAIRIIGAEQILPTLERKPGCFDCRRYPVYPTDPPTQDSGPFADLAQPTLEGAPA